MTKKKWRGLGTEGVSAGSPKNRVRGYEHPKFSILTTTDGSEKNIFVGQIFRGVEEFFLDFKNLGGKCLVCPSGSSECGRV